jgi:predicted nuclease of restriction endonuclease-like (RecB) superfamily
VATKGTRGRSSGPPSSDVGPLLERVVAILEEARTQVARAVNSAMVLAYWHIGRELVEYVQGGAARADYGERVIDALGAQLRGRLGRGYSATNLRYFRLFFQVFADREPRIHHGVRDGSPGVARLAGIHHSPSDESGTQAASTPRAGFSSRLSWTHYRTLSKVEDPAARSFYEIEADREGWSVSHLERQIHTMLFTRLRKSRSKAGGLDLARRGHVLERPIDLVKSPVVLDFLDLPDRHELRESDLERALLTQLSQFLLELGKGFAFVARQRRMTFDDEHLYVDLVFYNTILKCYLLIDLKIGKLTHQDVGQMDGYVRMFDAQGRTEGDGPTIGLILCAEENEAVARYSILHEHAQIFAARYVTYLPTVEELERELARERRLAEGVVEEPTGTAAPGKRPARRRRPTR